MAQPLTKPRDIKRAGDYEEIRPLVALCRAGKLFEIQDWIASAKPVNPPVPTGRRRGRSPLEVAVELGFHSLVKVLLEAGAVDDNREQEALKVVSISESKPGDFKPASAWPGTDKKRTAENSQGHGDGFTPIIITGRILLPSGKPALEPKFYRVNDSFLLGERKREQEALVYDPKKGRFVYVTSIFAAYSVGEGQAEPGPYQTGSSLISLEATGCKPLQIHFYDEMPDVEITLSEQAAGEKRD